MFGYDRRPELFKEPEPKEPNPLKWHDWFICAIGGDWREKGVPAGQWLYKRGAGAISLTSDEQLRHASPKVAELWAFETGRLP